MRVLTVRQPWAWAIFHGKDIENRDWPTAYRGPVLIHAAAGCTRREYDEARAFMESVAGIGWQMAPVPAWSELQRGVILGKVDIHDCVTLSVSPWFMGRYGFVLRRPVLLPEPIAIKGRLGFWDYELPPRFAFWSNLYA